MAEILDLRGREITVPPPAVLADPSGRRARLLARGGRVLALGALLWVAALALAGVGILPAGDVPLGQAVAGPQAPSGLHHLPKPTAPSAQDLRPASPANSASAASRYGRALNQIGLGSGQATGSALTAATQSGSGSRTGSANPTIAAGTTGNGAAGIGPASATSLNHAKGAAASGLDTTTAPGNSGSSPGQLRQATTPTGKSGLAPGRTASTPANGHTNLP